MGDGDGSDGGVGGAGDGGVGGDGGGGFDFFMPTPEVNTYMGDPGLASMYDANDPNDPYRNKKYMGQGFGLAPGQWNPVGAYLNTGSGVDNTGSLAVGSYGPEMLQSLGYTGSVYEPVGSGESFGGLTESKGWHDFLNDHNYRLATMYGGGPRGRGGIEQNITQAFDKSGNPVGKSTNWDNADDSEFGMVVGLLAALAGGAAGGSLAGLAGYGGGAAGAAATGAGAGFAGTASQTADIGDALKGAAIGGVSGGIGGAMGSVNPAGALGLDGSMGSAVNNVASGAIRGGVGAGLQGGNILGGALSGAGNAGANAAFNFAGNQVGNYFKGDTGGSTMPDSGYDYGSPNDFRLNGEGMFGGGSNPSYDLPPGLGSYGGNSFAPQQQASFNYGTANDYQGLGGGLGLAGGQQTPLTMEGVMGQPGAGLSLANRYTQPQQSVQAPQQKSEQGNPLKDMIRQAMGFSSGANGGRGVNFGDLGSNLLGMYSAYQKRKGAMDTAAGLRDMFGPNSAYAQTMRQTLARKDAAAGRRSQYGPREVELQARLAELNSRNAPQLAHLYESGNQGLNGILNNSLNIGRNLGLGGALSRMMQPAPSFNGYNPASDYNYQNGSDIGG